MSTITEQLKKRILVLDGAMGTMIQNANLTAEDFGGEEYEGCNEYLNVTPLTSSARFIKNTLRQAPISLKRIRSELQSSSLMNTGLATLLMNSMYGLRSWQRMKLSVSPHPSSLDLL